MLKKSLSVALTLLVVGVTAIAAYALWNRNFHSPWTRDARVHADVIGVAPDVSGRITRVAVHANQDVSTGYLLFTVDREPYRIAVEQAQAALDAAITERAQKQAQSRRRAHLDREVVSSEDREAALAAAAAAQAQVAQAKSQLAAAQLNLERTEVHAPVDGYITNLNVQAGDYGHTGEALLALVDRHSFRVDGYFEESKIQNVRPGDPVRIRLLGGGPPLRGHVESVARAIADTENQGLLSSVNPNFHWVRLAQRIPVRIALDEVPEALQLSAGMTCTVTVEAADGGAR
ncbi:HlyD family secretion protein [Algiphilus sp. W345]|uniref:HlyD family secretion protein n=1 Tax=Banduia mediterranea TaxID=3075609 RepID=A0ABU2WGS9_9GAMM|nr:HlyD family secretion protein [Algiphilus sp. W345]MDT0496723.1 HlyD family secretion protein [Algiphilus sp. W345]